MRPVRPREGKERRECSSSCNFANRVLYILPCGVCVCVCACVCGVLVCMCYMCASENLSMSLSLSLFQYSALSLSRSCSLALALSLSLSLFPPQHSIPPSRTCSSYRWLIGGSAGGTLSPGCLRIGVGVGGIRGLWMDDHAGAMVHAPCLAVLPLWT